MDNKLLESIKKIRLIALKNLDDPKLRANGARTLNRIIDEADGAISFIEQKKEL